MKLYAGSMMHRLFILPWRQDFEFPLNNGLPFCMETWHINHTCSPSLIRFVVDVANTMFYLGNLRENRYNCAQQTSGMVARQLLLMPPDFRDPDSILTFGAVWSFSVLSMTAWVSTSYFGFHPNVAHLPPALIKVDK